MLFLCLRLVSVYYCCCTSQLLKKSEIKSPGNFHSACLALSLDRSIRLFYVEEYKKTFVEVLENKFWNERVQLILDLGSCVDLPKSLSVSGDKNKRRSENVSQKHDSECDLISDCGNESCFCAVTNHLNENEGKWKENPIKLINSCSFEKSKPGEGPVKFVRKYSLKKGPCCVCENSENETFSSETCRGVALLNVLPHKSSHTYSSKIFDFHTERKTKVTCTEPLSGPLHVCLTGPTGLNKAPSHSSQSEELNTTKHNKKDEKKARKLNQKLLKHLRKLTSIPFSNREADNPVISIRKLREKTKKLCHNAVEEINKLISLPLSEQPWGNPVIFAYPSRRKKNERPVERRSQRNQPQAQLHNVQPSEEDPTPEDLHNLGQDRFALPSQPEQRNLQHLLPTFTPRVEPVSASTQELRRLSTRPRHPQYAEERARRESFADWPSDTGQNPENMITNGFFYTGRVDLIRCFMCGIGLKDWSAEDESLFEHVRHSPDCPFLFTLLGQDVLDAYKAALLPGRARPTAARDGSSNVQGASRPESAPFSSTEGADLNVRTPQYAELRQRIESFSEWPRSVTQSPRQLAEAGFFHTGEGDTVRCFQCDGGLQQWDPRDDPWIEHTRWFPHCPYVRQVKGLEYVELVQRAIRETVGEDEEPVEWLQDVAGAMANLTVHSAESSSEPPEPAVTTQTILEMGYSREALAEAMRRAEEIGMVNYTPKDLLEILLEMGSAGELSPPEPKPQTTEEGKGATSDVTEDDPLFVTIENKSLRKVLKCSECKIGDKNILFLPCTHHCLCEKCAEKVTKCPMCNKDIIRKIKTYMS